MVLYYDKDKERRRRINGVIMKDEKVRGFGIINEKGNGYIYPLSMMMNDEEKEIEYEVKGECSCCMECLDDENCGEEGGMKKYCMGNICVECKNDNNCRENEEICHYGKCMENGNCRKDNDCNENEICNMNGDCKIGCRNDDKCKTNEICNMMNGECINGCHSDNDCHNGELCINSQCDVSGCRDNFDCNDYDNVCINNECITINENTEECLSDNDCSNDYYCDYEYLICVKMRKETDHISKRNIELLPSAVCTVYGVISLLVIVSSYSIVQNIAQTRLKDECDKKCSNLYHTFSDSKLNSDVNIEETDHKRRVNSYCKGKCRWNQMLKTPQAVDHAKLYCKYLEYSLVVDVEEKIDYFDTHQSYPEMSPANDIFYHHLSRWCRTYTYEYLYVYPKKRRKILKKSIICVADKSTINCEPVRKSTP